MYLCLTIYVASLTRKQTSAYLLDMTIKGNGGSVRSNKWKILYVVFDEASSWWSLENKDLSDSNKIEEILQQKMGEQTTHIQLNVDVLEDPSDIDVDEQEVIQSRESDKNETTHQQLR